MTEAGAEARRILALAWPVMLTSLNWTIMHVMDVALVGHAGTGELGALAAGRTLIFVVMVMGFGALSGVLVYTARADGAGDAPGTGATLRGGLLLALAIGLTVTLVLLPFAEPLIRAAGVAEAMVPAGGRVTQVMAIAFPFQFVMGAAAYFLEGVSRPRRVMLVNIVMLPVNALLAWAWIGGHLGLPAMGAVGAVAATTVVSMAGMAAMLAMCWTLPDAEARGIRRLDRAAWRAAVRGVPRLAGFGAAPALTSAIEIAGFSFLIALSTQLGAAEAGAFQAMFSLHNLVFAIGLGLASATGVRVGNAVGSGAPELARPRAMIAAALGVVLMGAVGIAYVSAADLLARPFSDDAAVTVLAAGALGTVAPFLPFDGIQVILVYALRSLGDQVAAGVNGVIAFGMVTGGSGWMLVRAGWGMDALVWATIAGIVVAALLQGARLMVVTGRISASNRSRSSDR